MELLSLSVSKMRTRTFCSEIPSFSSNSVFFLFLFHFTRHLFHSYRLFFVSLSLFRCLSLGMFAFLHIFLMFRHLVSVFVCSRECTLCVCLCSLHRANQPTSQSASRASMIRKKIQWKINSKEKHMAVAWLKLKLISK